MKQRANCWPACPEPDVMFGAAILVCGPCPPEGWSVTRTPGGAASYVVHRRKESSRFVRASVAFFRADIDKRYSIRGWSGNHRDKLAKKWKNEFLLWLWRKVDES